MGRRDRRTRRVAASRGVVRPERTTTEMESTCPSTSNVLGTGGLVSSPGSYRIIAGQNARNLWNGRHEMRVCLSTYGTRGDVEPTVGLGEECDAPVATGVMPTGVWG